MQYKLVEAVSADELMQRINELLNDGWQPLGGVACLAEGPYGDPCYMQAMIRR